MKVAFPSHLHVRGPEDAIAARLGADAPAVATVPRMPSPRIIVKTVDVTCTLEGSQGTPAPSGRHTLTLLLGWSCSFAVPVPRHTQAHWWPFAVPLRLSCVLFLFEHNHGGLDSRSATVSVSLKLFVFLQTFHFPVNFSSELGIIYIGVAWSRLPFFQSQQGGGFFPPGEKSSGAACKWQGPELRSGV